MFKVILILIFAPPIHCIEQLLCDKTKSTLYPIIWPSTYSCTYSNPLCLNENWIILKRCCIKGVWDLEPTCQNINPCPEDFMYYNGTREICFTLTNPGPYLPKCPYPDVLYFDTYKVLITKDLAPVWMPVKRDVYDGLDFLRWREPNFFYMDEYDGPLEYKGKLLGKNCLIYYSDSNVSLVSCDEHYPAICAYPLITTQRNNLCGEKICYPNDLDPFSNCFCFDNGEPNKNLAEFIKPHQNLFSKLLKNTSQCLFGLGQIEGKPMWVRSRSPLNYSFWPPDTSFDANKSYDILSGRGWTLNESQVFCYIYEKEVTIKKPTLKLAFEKSSEIFVVKAVNHNSLKWAFNDGIWVPLIMCFSNTLPMSLLYKFKLQMMQTDDADEVKFFFIPYLKGPGDYWCEAFSYPSLEVIKSDVVHLPNNSAIIGEFTSIVKADYDENYNPLSSTTVNSFNSFLSLRLRNNDILSKLFSTYFRFFKIINVDEENHKITFNLHFTLKVPGPIAILINEIKDLKNALTESLFELVTQKKIEILDVLSSEFCQSELTNEFNVTLTWKTAMADEWIYPNEYCFTSKGERLKRQCQGTFTDGRALSKITEPCELVKPNPVINLLSFCTICNCCNTTDIMNTTTQFLNSNYDLIGPLDLYIISDIMALLKVDHNLNLTQFAEMVASINRVNRNVLYESQIKLNATDRILALVDEIGIISETNSSFNENENFTLILETKETLKGVAIYSDEEGNYLKPKILYEHIDDSNIDHEKNLKCLLSLDQKLIKQIQNDSKVTKFVVTLYMNANLFNRNKTKMNIDHISIIFGFTIPNFKDKFAGPVTCYHKIPNGDDFKRDCSYWHYGNKTKGDWKIDNNDNIIKGFSKCVYWHNTHFALLLLPNRRFFKDNDILDIITKINCILSLMGLFGIFVTGIFFKNWRINTGNQILMNFAFSVALQIIAFEFSGTIKKENKFLCISIGIILHYSIISEFCWMFVIAILQFKRFVVVLSPPPKHILLKSCTCGWGLPLFPALCVAIIDPDTYINGHIGLCYPSGLALYLGIWLPVFIIIVINCIMFIYIIYNVVHKETKCIDLGANEILFQWRLAIMLFFMLGLTWLFGFLMLQENGFIFGYLFCFTATLQGFLMFLFFIAFNRTSRKLYVVAFKRRLQKVSSF